MKKFCRIQYKIIIGQEIHLTYFEEPYILSLKEELHVEVNVVLEDYEEVKEKNIEIFEEINEGHVIEEEPEIKIAGEINEDLIIEKDLEVEIVELIKEEIIEEVINDLDEVKLDYCNIQASIFWWKTPKQSLNFIGVD